MRKIVLGAFIGLVLGTLIACGEGKENTSISPQAQTVIAEISDLRIPLTIATAEPQLTSRVFAKKYSDGEIVVSITYQFLQESYSFHNLLFIIDKKGDGVVDEAVYTTMSSTFSIFDPAYSYTVSPTTGEKLGRIGPVQHHSSVRITVNPDKGLVGLYEPSVNDVDEGQYPNVYQTTKIPLGQSRTRAYYDQSQFIYEQIFTLLVFDR